MFHSHPNVSLSSSLAKNLKQQLQIVNASIKMVSGGPACQPAVTVWEPM